MALVSALAIGVGGSVGALARYATGLALESQLLGTFIVNTVGSFVLGVVFGAGVENPAALAVTVGFCGAFTTFSSFAVETIRLVEDRKWKQAVLNAVGTLLVALVAVLAGGVLGSRV